MSKTITLRLDDPIYEKFCEYAQSERRSIANLIETLALRRLEEEVIMDDFEMEEITSNRDLLERLDRGHKAAEEKRGRFVD